MKSETINITVGQEISADFKAVFDLIKKVFEKVKCSDQQEQFLFERLRKSKYWKTIDLIHP